MTLFLFFLFGSVIFLGWLIFKLEVRYHKRHIASKSEHAPLINIPKPRIKIPVTDGTSKEITHTEEAEKHERI